MYLCQQQATCHLVPNFIHLHSTMYLFQLDVKSVHSCFLDIYIPLCIYFNTQSRKSSTKVLVFTFHYVSISTFGFDFMRISWRTFTFHYVSISTRRISIMIRSIPIYIPLCIYFNRSVTTFVYGCSHIYIPLCIYFNLIALFSRQAVKCIYIPLCIYFNPEYQPHNQSYQSFTFHYVSISTLSRAILWFLYPHLHSTMYLFQLDAWINQQHRQGYLHSTMYLFQLM